MTTWSWKILAPLAAACLVSCTDEKPANDAKTADPSANKAKPSAADGSAPNGMVLIPEGTFLMGSVTGHPNEAVTASSAPGAPPRKSIRKVKLSSFYMDETEVTNAQFAKFVEATGYKTIAERPMTPAQMQYLPPEERDKGPFNFGSMIFVKTPSAVPLTAMPPPWFKIEFSANWRSPLGGDSTNEGKENHPVINLCYPDAVAYATWAGKRLPTEAEWEYAARGGLVGKKYVWGNSPLPNDNTTEAGSWKLNMWQGQFPTKDLASDGFDGSAPVKSYEPNGYGLYDMAGNVWEMCEDWFSAKAYMESPAENPKGPGRSDPGPGGAPIRVMRGGSWRIHREFGQGTNQQTSEVRVACRNHYELEGATNDVGFRCVKDL